MEKRAINHLLIFMLIFTGSLVLGKMSSEGSIVPWVVCILLIMILVFNVVVRKKYAFMPYFLSKWNVVSSKFSKEFEFDIPIDLAFDKILEIIANSPFHLQYASKTDFEIFATSDISWWSWGENIYIQLISDDVRTRVKFDSAAVCGAYSWGKNENNFETFLQKLEDSLIV